MSTEPLTRYELDRMMCSHPGCDHTAHTDGLVLNSQCHVKRPQIVRYWGGGVVEVRCKLCNKFVCSIAVSVEDRVALDEKIMCDDPDCKEPVENHRLLIKAPCHPAGGVMATYAAGRLELACASCKRPTSHLHVKEGAASA